MDKKIDSTKLSHFEKVIKKLRRDVGVNDMDVSFEYICASCFPSIWSNIQKTLQDEHMTGYLEGKEAAQNDSNR